MGVMMKKSYLSLITGTFLILMALTGVSKAEKFSSIKIRNAVASEIAEFAKSIGYTIKEAVIRVKLDSQTIEEVVEDIRTNKEAEEQDEKEKTKKINAFLKRIEEMKRLEEYEAKKKKLDENYERKTKKLKKKYFRRTLKARYKDVLKKGQNKVRRSEKEEMRRTRLATRFKTALGKRPKTQAD
jgi:hypothetical protein